MCVSDQARARRGRARARGLTHNTTRHDTTRHDTKRHDTNTTRRDALTRAMAGTACTLACHLVAAGARAVRRGRACDLARALAGRVAARPSRSGGGSSHATSLLRHCGSSSASRVDFLVPAPGSLILEMETKRPGLWGRPHCKGVAIGSRGEGPAAAVSVRSVFPPSAVIQPAARLRTARRIVRSSVVRARASKRACMQAGAARGAMRCR